jgi:hypothetical protein
MLNHSLKRLWLIPLFLLSLAGAGFFAYQATATVNEVTAANRYTGNGSTTVFSYGFKILVNTGVEVSVDNVVKTLTTDYTVSGVGASGGGSVTFLTVPANGSIVALLRKQPLAQSSTYTTNEAFPSTRLEKDLDKAIMTVQQLKEQMGRALTFAKASTLTNQTVDTPVVGSFARAKVGGGIDWATVVSAGSVSVPVAVNQGGTGATDAATARTNLGIAAIGDVLDTVLRVSDEADNTKKLSFQVGGFTTGATRTLTPPNANLTLPNPTAAGDLTIASGAGVQTNLPVGASGTIPMSRAASSLKLAYVAALNKYIYGFTYANNGADAANDIDIAAGGAMDATGAYWMTGAALTKQIDVAWAVGTNAGMLDSGVVGNNDYYLWAIGRSDTGVVDYTSSLSSTAPTMPSNYDFKRRIGWFRRVAGAIVAFHVYEQWGGGIEFLWDSPTLDLDLVNTLTTTRRTDAMKVPLNFSTTAIINVQAADTVQNIVYVYCPDLTDVAPSTTAAPLANVYSNATGSEDYYQLRIRTSATGTIASRASVATMNSYRISTVGFTWARRD